MFILTANNKSEEKLLRKKVSDFNFSKHTLKEIKDLIKNMRLSMKKANGVGLSANQIGLDLKVFVAQVENKFYTVFNPKITKFSEEEIAIEEGCLSVPEMFGQVERSLRVTVEGQDISGKKIKIKTLGLLARVFQHEIDHLNGVLFIDKCKDVYQIPSKENLAWNY
mgnify:CR=1 FL=1